MELRKGQVESVSRCFGKDRVAGALSSAEPHEVRMIWAFQGQPHHTYHDSLSMYYTVSWYSKEVPCLYLHNHTLVVGYLWHLYFIKHIFRPNSFHLHFPELGDTEVVYIQYFQSPFYAESIDFLWVILSWWMWVALAQTQDSQDHHWEGLMKTRIALSRPWSSSEREQLPGLSDVEPVLKELWQKELCHQAF